jgi:hypothetical protein
MAAATAADMDPASAATAAATSAAHVTAAATAAAVTAAASAAAMTAAATTAAATGEPQFLGERRWSGIFLVVDMERAQADIEELLLTEKDLAHLTL